MPMCVSDCNCKWCIMSDMTNHPLFKERMDALIKEYSDLVPPKKQRIYFGDG